MKFICNKEELAKSHQHRHPHRLQQIPEIHSGMHSHCGKGWGNFVGYFRYDNRHENNPLCGCSGERANGHSRAHFLRYYLQISLRGIHFEREGSTILLTGENSRASLQEMDAEQFPAFPALEGEKLCLGRKMLREMVEKTAFSVYTGEDKPIFTAFCLRQTQRSKASALWASMESAWQKIPLLPRARRKFAR